ncbi:ParB/RepB/Spo0J family partition protein [Lactimicrobium massiliense]|uniref:ParB/RepB/Spo0J family partition protein n=1 Tax=Lactimicrobium massiliense TaxID=2161814 RepID=UPI000D5524FC|nr:ParB/RepB/Spo0J family partition protein [Lactimicrobium massiliense]
MQRKGANVSLKSVDDLFSTQEERDTTEHVQEIPLSELHPFKDHPFKVLDDEAMQKTVESIREYGVLTPAIARPRPEGGYELISGHRRHHASELAGKETMPVIVRNMDDDAATILMVDSNLQREEILPSERAKAYKMKLEALKHQGERRDLTSGQLGPKLDTKRSNEIVADQAGQSVKQVQRFIRLTNLIPELQDMVDEKKISFNPAVELSYLTPEEQKMFAEAMEASQIAPSLSQAQRMKKMSQQGQLTQESMEDMLSEDKKAPLDRVVFDQSQIRKYFPKSYTTKQMQEKIIQLLEQWQRKQQRDMER